MIIIVDWQLLIVDAFLLLTINYQQLTIYEFYLIEYTIQAKLRSNVQRFLHHPIFHNIFAA